MMPWFFYRDVITRCVVDIVMTWKHFPRYWPIIRGNQRSLVDFPNKESVTGKMKGHHAGDVIVIVHYYMYDPHQRHCVSNYWQPDCLSNNSKIHLNFPHYFTYEIIKLSPCVQIPLHLIMPDSQQAIPDSKIHGANMGPTWVPSDPDGPHVGPMNLAIRDVYEVGKKIHWHLVCQWFKIRFHGLDIHSPERPVSTSKMCGMMISETPGKRFLKSGGLFSNIMYLTPHRVYTWITNHIYI